jgi:regulator of protease activity HflC (stomatin/prohibitin superfamily)
VLNSVYRRMQAERHRVAKEFRSKGAEEAEIIRAAADKERTIILAKKTTSAIVRLENSLLRPVLMICAKRLLVLAILPLVDM